MGERVTIRRAGIGDLEFLVPLFDAYRVFYGQPSDDAAARRFMADRLRAGDSVVLLAEDNAGSALGFAQLYPAWTSVSAGRRWLLNDLFVAPAARRCGVGRLLLKQCMEHCRATGALDMALLTEHTNAPAQALYEAEGWKRDATYQRYTWKP